MLALKDDHKMAIVTHKVKKNQLDEVILMKRNFQYLSDRYR